jgi:hypothetical protein
MDSHHRRDVLCVDRADKLGIKLVDKIFSRNGPDKAKAWKAFDYGRILGLFLKHDTHDNTSLMVDLKGRWYINVLRKGAE